MEALEDITSARNSVNGSRRSEQQYQLEQWLTYQKIEGQQVISSTGGRSFWEREII
jgi:hypothetical protein